MLAGSKSCSALGTAASLGIKLEDIPEDSTNMNLLDNNDDENQDAEENLQEDDDDLERLYDFGEVNEKANSNGLKYKAVPSIPSVSPSAAEEGCGGSSSVRSRESVQNEAGKGSGGSSSTVVSPKKHRVSPNKSKKKNVVISDSREESSVGRQSQENLAQASEPSKDSKVPTSNIKPAVPSNDNQDVIAVPKRVIFLMFALFAGTIGSGFLYLKYQTQISNILSNNQSHSSSSTSSNSKAVRHDDDESIDEDLRELRKKKY